MENSKMICLQALKIFIEDSSNENKMELIIVYDDIEEDEREAVLGTELNKALVKIIQENYHPDEYLEELNKTFFS